MPAPPPLLRRLTDWFSRPSWEEYLDQRREAARLRAENARLREACPCGVEHAREVVLRALVLYRAALEAEDAGHHVAIIGPDDEIIRDFVEVRS